MAIEIKTTDIGGQSVGSLTLDAESCGGKVKPRLLHAASVMYHNNLRQGSACSKTRAEIAGSTKKLFKQKGGGRARAGTRKSGTRRGGGVIHGPKPRNYVYRMPKKARRAAIRNAILTKAMDGQLHVVKGIDFDAPKTKSIVSMVSALGVGVDTALIATEGLKRNVYLSGRNVPGLSVSPAAEINARDILTHKHLVIEESAFVALSAKPTYEKPSRKPKGSRKDSATVKGAEEAQS